MRIIVQPIGKVDLSVINNLKTILGRTFGCPVEIAPNTELPEQAYKKGRGQYNAHSIIGMIKPSDLFQTNRILAVIDADIYSAENQFVFGHAEQESQTAIISLSRLRPELPPDTTLFLNRAAKEAIHELGHTFGLNHCSKNKCVMHFSHSLSDTDVKGPVFCSQCQPKLIQ
jgi:archaemetzincin